MKFTDFLDRVPEAQEMQVVFEGLEVSGQQEAIACMLDGDVYNGVVTEVEAEENVLKVWVKESNECQK